MIKFDDRVVQSNNNYLTVMGSMAGAPADLNLMRQGGEQLQAKLDALIEEETQRGNDNLRVLTDLTDLRVLSDKNRFTTGIREMLSLSVAMSDNARALVEMGFNNPTSWAEFNVASAEVMQIPKKVAFKIYHNLVDAVNHVREDELVMDIALSAIDDLIAERMTFERYADIHKIHIDEDNKDKVQMLYNSGYTEWKENEGCRLIAAALADPLSNILIDPSGIEDVKEVLYQICPVEANEWINNLDVNTIYSGEVFEKLMTEYKLDREALNQFAHVVEKFMTENQSPSEISLGGNQTVKPFYSINIATVILHMMITASAELWGSSDELSEYTEYIVDLFREELSNLTNIEYDETTPYKMLSVVSAVNNIVISRIAATRASSRNYILAQGGITSMINEELLELSHKEAELKEDENPTIETMGGTL